VTVIAGVLQLLLAAGFVVMPVVALRYGSRAQRAAEADVVRQGQPGGLLLEHGVRIEERRSDLPLPFAIAAILAVLGTLNLAGVDLGRILTFVLQPLMLVAGGFVTAGQVFVTRFVEAGLRSGGVRDVDVRSFIGAAQAVFPGWVRPVIVTRFLLATAGSAVIILLLALS
jgi:hypothetical protein